MRQLDESSLEVDIKKSQGVNKLFAQLTEHDVRVLSMRNKANRLEELFVRLLTADQTHGQSERETAHA